MSGGMSAIFQWPPGGGELLLIGLVILLVFGRRIPDVMRALGRGVTQFKKGLRDVEDEVMKDGSHEEEDAKLPPADGGQDKRSDG